MANNEELALVEPVPAPPADILICDVCYDVFHRTKREPRLFPCGHTFCQPCINSVCLTTPFGQTRGVSCATCRKVVKVENWGNPTETFPPNYAVMNLLEKYEESELNKSFACFHCKLQFHEKLMTFCKTCFIRNDFNYSEKDFLGRPNSRLMCGGCANIHHNGSSHSFASLSNVNGRWNYRSLYKSCSRAAEKQASQIDGIILAFQKGIEVAKQYKTNLNETVRQMEAHASESNNRTVLRNFMKNSTKSSAFFTSIRESAQRLSEPNSDANQMLGSVLFPSGLDTNRSDARFSDTAQYKKMLEDLFTKHHNTNNRNGRGSVVRDRVGSSRSNSPLTVQAAVLAAPRVNQAPQPVPPPQGPLLPIRVDPIPVPAPQFVPVPVAPRFNAVPADIFGPIFLNLEEQMQQNRNIMEEVIQIPNFVFNFAPQVQPIMPQNDIHAVPNPPGAENLDAYRMLLQVQPALFEERVAHNFQMELPLLFQPLIIPPVPSFTADNLNIILDYFFYANDERRAMIIRDNQYDHLGAYQQLESARRRLLRLATAIGPPPRRQDRIVLFYQLPFHFFNASLPSLYTKSLGDVIQNFIMSLTEGGNGVHEYFFRAPNPNRNFDAAQCRSIKAVLMSLMIILIPGQFPYTFFERKLQTIEEGNNGDVRPVEPAEEDEPGLILEAPEPEGVIVEPINRQPRIVPVEPVMQPVVIVLDDADNGIESGSEDDEEDGEEGEVVESDSGSDLESENGESDLDVEDEDQDEDEVEDESDDEVPVVIQENDMVVEEEVVILNEDPDIQEIPVERPRRGRPRRMMNISPPREQRNQAPIVVEPNNDAIRDLKRQDRNNFVFQVADLVPEPPARATRAAKRRIHDDPVNVPGTSLVLPAADPTPRRGRGRPRKYPLADSSPPTRKHRSN